MSRSARQLASTPRPVSSRPTSMSAFARRAAAAVGSARTALSLPKTLGNARTQPARYQLAGSRASSKQSDILQRVDATGASGVARVDKYTRHGESRK